MKLEHVLTGKVEWYLNVLALHPRGRDVLKILIPKLQEWYGFTEPRELNPRSGIKLTGGEFSLTGDGRNITGVSIDIFHNGFVASTTTNTADTEGFLLQVQKRLSGEAELTFKAETIRKRRYESEVVVRAESDLIALQRFDAFSKALATKVYPSNPNVVLQCSGLVFDSEPGTPDRRPIFLFERRADEPFAENLYYSRAPLQTADHLQILDVLETTLGA